ncbi:tetratricopeptide repeat-containing sensor histidine kinase [Carboxylicivirga sp. N1Y90]|uniref:tetratricopeptide repeat-containing sensor histidine kinase n=1 Tax=Carboxylicivirga fragile TaxID=3417571 RepID=UPI003D333F2F|nr:tetratricopeptide repeat protein [Marinilabiliaceae bacterium N1Y90]
MIFNPNLSRFLVLVILVSNIYCKNSSAQSVSSSQSAAHYLEQINDSTSKDKIIELCNLAINELSEKESDPIKFQTYLNTGIVLYENNFYNEATDVLILATSYRDVINEIDKIGEAYNYLGWIASANNEYDSAISYLNEASSYYLDSDKKLKLGNAQNSIGAMYWYQRNYSKALSSFNQVLQIGETIDDSELLIKALTNKGVVLNQLAQYNEALICLERALELNQLNNNTRSKASLLNNLGNVLYSLKQYDSAIRNYRESLKIYNALNDAKGISDCYNNIGEVFLELGDVQSALDNYTISLSHNNDETDSADIAVAYVNIGRAHQTGKHFNKAITYFEKALKILVNFNDPALQAETYLHLGQTVLSYNDYSQAEHYLEKSKNLAIKYSEKTILSQCYNSLSDLYKKQYNYKQALHYKTLHVEIKDSLTDEKAIANSVRMEAVYNLLQKEETISKLEQENIHKSLDLTKAESTRTIYLIVSIALLIFLIILFLLFRLRRNTSRQLKEKNEELGQLNATKDKFFSIIAHDLKSPFSSLMGFAEMLALHAESKNNKEVIEYSQIIHSSTKRLLSLVENLLQWSRTQLGTTEYNPALLDISIHTHNIVTLLRLNAEEKDIVISPKVEKELVAWADLNLFSTVLRNLISNAIKFSRVGSVIYVAASKKGEMVEVTITDSGVGMRQENLEKLFQVDSTFSTKGTFNEKGTGIGLVLCKEFVEINKGTIWAESALEKGSKFYFTLPIDKTE